MNYQTFKLFYQYMQIIFLFQIIPKSFRRGQNIKIGLFLPLEELTSSTTAALSPHKIVIMMR